MLDREPTDIEKVALPRGLFNSILCGDDTSGDEYADVYLPALYELLQDYSHDQALEFLDRFSDLLHMPHLSEITPGILEHTLASAYESLAEMSEERNVAETYK